MDHRSNRCPSLTVLSRSEIGDGTVTSEAIGGAFLPHPVRSTPKNKLTRHSLKGIGALTGTRPSPASCTRHAALSCPIPDQTPKKAPP